jgi:Ras family protein T1
VVNSVETAGAQKYLIVPSHSSQYNNKLEEIPEQETDTVLKDPKSLDKVDVICLTYDSANPDSFAFIANLRVPHHLILTLRITSPISI